MTTTPTHEQVAAAQRKAAELAARLDAAEAERYEREQAVRAAEAQRRHSEHTDELRAERDAAEEDLARISADDSASLDELWRAFAAVKVASATYFKWSVQNAANADGVLGVDRSHIGVDRPRPRPQIDTWADTSWSQLLQRLLDRRAQARNTEIQTELEARINRLLEAAR